MHLTVAIGMDTRADDGPSQLVSKDGFLLRVNHGRNRSLTLLVNRPSLLIFALKYGCT
jgi:hypothetical protein